MRFPYSIVVTFGTATAHLSKWLPRLQGSSGFRYGGWSPLTVCVFLFAVATGGGGGGGGGVCVCQNGGKVKKRARDREAVEGDTGEASGGRK